LFDVTRYGEVMQMTSDVCATLQPGQSLKEVMAALYPCGSITGAPKRRAMQIIQECEQIERGLYTGGLGWWLENGDFCLSVVIRTVMLSRMKEGVRRGHMGVGSGIVFDSVAQEEYQECAWKANFLRHGAPTFFLFETMALSKEAGYRFLPLHKKRLMASARYFGFKYDEREIDCVLERALVTLATSTWYRAKLSLYVDGKCQIDVVEYLVGENKVKVGIAKKTTSAKDIFLRHKTSVRGVYDAAWREAEGRGEFDQLFFNTEGFLTEGARSSVFVKLDGCWYTPPLEVGVLPGVMRQQVLLDPKWQAVEFKLTREDVLKAQEVMVCNALRGVMQAELVWDDEKAG
jgi:para-aminobenzoate synthetase/4-amino-4-deoxychorismate lyase